MQILSAVFLISLFFPIRKVFFTNSAYLTGAYSDFTSFSLYLSDILIFTTWFLIILPRGGFTTWYHHVVKGLGFLIFWLILAFLWHINNSNSLNWYFLLKYAELIVAYGTFAYLFAKYEVKQVFLKAFLFLATIQSIIALAQFYLQKSVGFGLNALGETIISPNIQGIAKIVSGGTTYIRAYGTFPHPNLLAAFLVVAIILSLYLYLKSSKATKIILVLTFFVNLLGLTLTFSRAGYAAALIGILVILTGDYITTKLVNYKTIGLVLLSLLLVFILFKPFIISRATLSDQATTQRKEYNKIGLKMIARNPIFGVGIGESVLHMEQFAKKRLNSWEKQPIHNYFIIAAAELGIPFALILIWVLFQHLYKLVISIKYKISDNINYATGYLLLATLLSFLLLMLFDHYFYTLQQTQLLLWIVLGIIAAETQNTKPHPLTSERALSKLNP